MSPTQSAADRTEVGPVQTSTLGPVQMSAPNGSLDVVDGVHIGLKTIALVAVCRTVGQLTELLP